MVKFYKKNGPFRRRVRTIGEIAKTASSALAVAKTVAGLINVEFKVKNTTNPAYTPDSSGQVVQLTDIDQGDSSSTRDGGQVKLKSIEAKWHILKHASATYTMVRLIWFIDLIGTNADPPTVDELLSASNTYTPRNLNNKHRFLILKDYRVALGDVTVKVGEWFKKVNAIATYSTSNGTDYTGNQIWLAMLSSEATNTPTIAMYNRVRFLDN